MGYRLIALDIDGTLRTDAHPMAQATRDALNRVRQAGAVVTLATGRTYRSARPFFDDLGLVSPVVTFQGARVNDPRTHEVLWHRPLTPTMAHRALDHLAPWDMEVVGHYADEIYVRQSTPWAEAYGLRSDTRVNVVEDLRALADMGPTRLVAVGEPTRVRELEREMVAANDGHLYVTRSLPHFCEVLHPKGGKEAALAWVCGRLGIGEDETVAFGNGYNDVPMLRWAGLGVAVGDAVPEVLAVADVVAPPAGEGGIAHVLERLLDEGRIG